MSNRQKNIMLCFNIVALIGILWSGFRLGVDVGRVFRHSAPFVSGGSNLFSWYGYTEYDWSLTITNYLFSIALATVLINIFLIIGFNMWNKRRK